MPNVYIRKIILGTGKVEIDLSILIEAEKSGEIKFSTVDRLKDTDIKTLKKAISITQGDTKEPKLIISADKMTPHQFVVRAMDAARQLGLVHLTFATKQANKK